MKYIILFFIVLNTSFIKAQNNISNNLKYEISDSVYINLSNLLDTTEYAIIQNESSLILTSKKDSFIYYFSPFPSKIVTSKNQKISKLDLFNNVFKNIYENTVDDTSNLFEYSIRSIKKNSLFCQISPKQFDNIEYNIVILNLSIILKIKNEYEFYMLNSIQKVRKSENVNLSLFKSFEEFFN